MIGPKFFQEKIICVLSGVVYGNSVPTFMSFDWLVDRFIDCRGVSELIIDPHLWSCPLYMCLFYPTIALVLALMFYRFLLSLYQLRLVLSLARCSKRPKRFLWGRSVFFVFCI